MKKAQKKEIEAVLMKWHSGYQEDKNFKHGMIAGNAVGGAGLAFTGTAIDFGLTGGVGTALAIVFSAGLQSGIAATFHSLINQSKGKNKLGQRFSGAKQVIYAYAAMDKKFSGLFNALASCEKAEQQVAIKNELQAILHDALVLKPVSKLLSTPDTDYMDFAFKVSIRNEKSSLNGQSYIMQNVKDIEAALAKNVILNDNMKQIKRARLEIRKLNR